MVKKYKLPVIKGKASEEKQKSQIVIKIALQSYYSINHVNPKFLDGSG